MRMRRAPETNVTTTMTPSEMLRSISLSAGKAGRAERKSDKVVNFEVKSDKVVNFEVKSLGQIQGGASGRMGWFDFDLLCYVSELA